MEEWLQINNETIFISIKAFPGSAKNEFAGIRDNRLCIRIASAPEDGKANDCMLDFIAKSLHCPKRDVVLKKGEKSRLKTVSVPAAYSEKLKKAFSF